MEEEPEQLPRLPAVSWDGQSQSFSNSASRKRALSRSQPTPSSGINSSDPAIFSSDDDPGLDNYGNGRRKRRYIGSWYQQQPASSDSGFPESANGSQSQVPRKRSLARQYDSGVFFGSDGTEEEFDGNDKISLPTHSKLQQLGKRPKPQLDPLELAVQDKIRAALDAGEETIDLWSMGLQQISNHTISLLSQAINVPVVTKDVAFEQKEPKLKLYMANNLLTKVPGSLFDLTNLTILSLRGNKLTELPPGIGKLHNLIELNVAQNQLLFLPAELAELMAEHRKLKTLVIHPNCFLEPVESAQLEEIRTASIRNARESTQPSPALLSESPPPYLVSDHISSSPLQVTSSSGRVLSAFAIPSDHGQAVPILSREQIKEQLQLVRARSNRLPTLFDLAIQKCNSTSDLEEMAGVMPPELSHLAEVLQRALAQKSIGGYTCSKCRRDIIVPALEWIEWRATYRYSFRLSVLDETPDALTFSSKFGCVGHDGMVPYLYRACSWACGPDDSPGRQRNLFLAYKKQ